jgi:hypothetical protein
MTRKAFDKYDEPVNIDIDPEEGLKVLLQIEPREDSPNEASDN